MSYETLLTRLAPNGILTITLNRPDKLNALNQQVFTDLSDTFNKAKTDNQVKGLIITGAGPKAFCAGADITRLATADAIAGRQFAEEGQAVFTQLETLDKPSVAAINGYAFGGGCELAMGASIRIASSSAQFGQPEVKLGVIPGYGGTQRLAKLIGKGRAMDLCLTGRFIDAETALAWGLISEITAPTELIARAEAILTTITTMAPLAVASMITVINQGFDLPLQDALQLEALHFGWLCATQDKQEGTLAFMEKRTAVFSGK